MSFTSVSPASAHTGMFGASLGPGFPVFVEYGTLSQTLATTAGTKYFITFWLRNTGRPSAFGVLWDGNLAWGWPNPDDFPYQKIAIGPIVASTASTNLTFFFYNTPAFVELDDVVVYADQGGTTGCTSIDQPGMAGYLTETHKCDFGTTLFTQTTMCRNADSSLAASFMGPIEIRRIGAGWATWSSPPDAEEAAPYVGFNLFALTETINLVSPAAVAGVEVEPNTFDPFFTIVASFRDAAGNELHRITRDITGRGGARLFAASCGSASIASISISSPPEAQGFAIAQVRSNAFSGATQGSSQDVELPPVSPNATSNTQ